MNEFVVQATHSVDEADARAASMGPRFGRLDILSQLSVLAVEGLAVDFSSASRARIGLCLTAGAGSLSTDVEFWHSRESVGGPSPTLFAYTLPSAALGEIAIRYQLTGPNLCLVGPDMILEEACDLMERGEVDSCLCIACNVVSPLAASILQLAPTARASALYLTRHGVGHRLRREIDRDIESVCQLLSDHRKAFTGAANVTSPRSTPK